MCFYTTQAALTVKGEEEGAALEVFKGAYLRGKKIGPLASAGVGLSFPTHHVT